MRGLAAVLLAITACEAPPDDITLQLDETSSYALDVTVDGEFEIGFDTGDATLLVEIAVDAGNGIHVDGLPAPHWFRPRPMTGAGTIRLTGSGAATVSVWSRGAAIGPVNPDRAVVWHEAVPLDDPTVISFASVMATIAEDGHGGALLDAWFDRFATTPYSQRTGPAALLDALRAQQGDDPTAWDLSALPFSITAVHNRVDLWPTEGQCGQLRVTAAAAPTETSIVHLIFLFRQPARADDVAPDGTVHCLGTARRWSRLSDLDGDAFADAARNWLADALARDRFALAESLELEDGVWEWRQWTNDLENPPLFQTVDADLVNAPGALRDEFLAFVEDNADALDQRTLLIPAQFRARFAQLGVDDAPPPIDLTGVDAAVLARLPRLADEIAIVGCPACHTEPADEFNQTYPGRFFSDFQFHEVEARAKLLDDMNAGREVAAPPFGPLQDY